MKEVKVVIGKGGRAKVLADGPHGAGTEKFTESLAKELGTIVERHKGLHHHHYFDDVTKSIEQR